MSEAGRIRVEELYKSREAHLQYLLVKVSERDWHGVMDAACDLREIEAELKGLRWEGEGPSTVLCLGSLGGHCAEHKVEGKHFLDGTRA